MQFPVSRCCFYTICLSLYLLITLSAYAADTSVAAAKAARAVAEAEANYQKRLLILPYSQVTVPIPIGNSLPQLGTSCKGTMTPGTIFYDAIKDQFIYCNSKEWRLWPPAPHK